MSVATEIDRIKSKVSAAYTAVRNKGVTTSKTKIADLAGEISKIQTGKTEQEKSVTITANGTAAVLPDSGKTLSKVIITTNVSGEGYTAYFESFIFIANTVTVSIEYADGSTETITATSGDIAGKSRSNVVKITFTDTDSERYVVYKMPASSGSEESLYLTPTATLVLTADVSIQSIGK